MGRTKYIFSGGLAFNEQEDMDKLTAYAKEGWLLERQKLFGYQLRKSEPKNIKYSLDYQKEADDDYFAYFDAGGWSHVYSTANEIHLFCATEGTTPIYTDKKSMIDNYETEKKNMGRMALPILIVTLLSIFFAVLGNIGWTPGIVGNVSLILGYTLLLPLVFTGMPYIGYSHKLRRLRKY